MILTAGQQLLALSWRQPYAELMLYGKMETRTWSTNYRGLVLICSSKIAFRMPEVLRISGEYQFKRILRDMRIDKGTLDTLGHAIAIGRLVDCRKMIPADEDKAYVTYQKDLYVHIYEDVRQIKPFPWKGVQGFKKVDQEIINAIEFLPTSK